MPLELRWVLAWHYQDFGAAFISDYCFRNGSHSYKLVVPRCCAYPNALNFYFTAIRSLIYLLGWCSMHRLITGWWSQTWQPSDQDQDQMVIWADTKIVHDGFSQKNNNNNNIYLIILHVISGVFICFELQNFSGPIKKCSSGQGCYKVYRQNQRTLWPIQHWVLGEGFNVGSIQETSPKLISIGNDSKPFQAVGQSNKCERLGTSQNHGFTLDWFCCK